MAETVFTISGVTADPMYLNDAPMAPMPDAVCVDEVTPLVATSFVTGLGGVGAGLYGVYKAGQRRTGASLFGFAAALGLWALSGRMMRAALVHYQDCRTLPPSGMP